MELRECECANAERQQKETADCWKVLLLENFTRSSRSVCSWKIFDMKCLCMHMCMCMCVRGHLYFCLIYYNMST